MHKLKLNGNVTPHDCARGKVYFNIYAPAPLISATNKLIFADNWL